MVRNVSCKITGGDYVTDGTRFGWVSICDCLYDYIKIENERDDEEEYITISEKDFDTLLHCECGKH